MEPPRWNIITPSQYEWERRGLDFIRTGLPDHDPYRAWTNFEFQTEDGAIYEVDLLVLTKQGFWLVEGKAWSGRIYGDAGTWTVAHDGRLRSEDNPVLLANRKALPAAARRLVAVQCLSSAAETDRQRKTQANRYQPETLVQTNRTANGSKVMKKRMDERLTRLADAAFAQAAQDVIERAKQSGTPIIVWVNEEVKALDPASRTERTPTSEAGPKKQG